MNREQVAQRVRGVMKATSQKEIDWKQVSDQSDISSLGFDSLSVLDLIYEVQKEFGLRFDAEELVGVTTFGELVDFLAGRLPGHP